MDITSQTEIFVDAGLTPGGSAGSALKLVHIVNGKVTDSGSVEVTISIGVRGGSGHREKQGAPMLSLTENRHTPRQVPWRQWKKEKKRFSISLKDENNGEKQKLIGCRVSKVDRSMSAEGEHQDEIEISALREE